MIKELIDILYNLARQHEYVKSFNYEEVNKVGGVGSDKYPLVFLEDPLIITPNGNNSLNTVIAHLDVVDCISNYDNEQIKFSHAEIQTYCMKIVTDFILMIKQLGMQPEFNLGIKEYNILTLRRWYDDNATGVRTTATFTMPNVECLIPDPFNPDKQFDVDSFLKDFKTYNAESCKTFDYKLPRFSV